MKGERGVNNNVGGAGRPTPPIHYMPRRARAGCIWTFFRRSGQAIRAPPPGGVRRRWGMRDTLRIRVSFASSSLVVDYGRTRRRYYNEFGFLRRKGKRRER